MRTTEQIAKEARTQYQVLQILKRTFSPLPLRQRTADQFISLFHEWQVAKYGKVIKPVNRASLLR